MTFRILHEDNHIIVVEKPINVLSQGDSTGNEDMYTAVKNYIAEKYNKPGNVYLGLIHRLDRPTGGVMVFAKTSKAAERLSADIRSQDVKKIYYAVVRGVPRQKKEHLTHYLLKNELTNSVSAVPMATEGAKKACLQYEIIETVKNCTLVRVILFTGRAHQIRVQMKEIGCPLWGDQKYGSNLNKPGQQLALWACQLSFTHPVTKEQMTFYAPPPDTMPWKAFSTPLDDAYLTRMEL